MKTHQMLKLCFIKWIDSFRLPLIVLLCLSYIYSQGQSCLPGYTTFDQNAINNFQTNNPGCTVISGNLTISGSTITDLGPLSVVTSIGGYLRILNADNLANLNGLQNISSIGDYLKISGCDMLQDLTGIGSLQTIGSYFEIHDNDDMINLNGVGMLTTVSSHLNVLLNNSLTNLLGLGSLTTVNGGLTVSFNNSITSLQGINNVSSFSGIRIESNPLLASVNGLNGLTVINGDFALILNPVLTDINALSGVSSMNGELYIYDNDDLVTLSGIDNINSATISYLTIQRNNQLNVCDVTSICNYLAGPDPFIINTNNTDCNSSTEILSECNAVPPGNDECSTATIIVVDPSATACTSPISITNLNATDSAPTNGTPSCGDYAGGDVWLQFVAPASEAIKLIVDSYSTWDNMGASLYDACISSTPIVNQEGYFSIQTEYTFTGLTSGSTYYLRLWEMDNDEVGTIDVCIEALPSPLSNDECSGATLLSVVPFGGSCTTYTSGTTINASDSAPINGIPSCGYYSGNGCVQGADVWYKFVAPSTGNVQLEFEVDVGMAYALYNSCGDNSPIPGHCNPFQGKFLGLSPGQSYYLRTWYWGNSQQKDFNLCVKELQGGPANDLCSNAQQLTVGPCPANQVSGTTVFSGSDGIPSCSGLVAASAGFGVWYKFTVPASGNVMVNLSGSNQHLSLYEACGGNEIYCKISPDGKILGNLIPGNEYFLLIWAKSGQEAAFTLCLSDAGATLANDICNQAISLPINTAGNCPAGNTNGTTSGAHEDGPRTCGLNNGNNINYGVWYKFVAPANGKVNYTLITPIGGFTPRIAFFDQCLGSELHCAYPSTGGLLDGLTAGNTYYINIWHDESLQGDFSICLSEASPVPVNDDCNNAQSLTLSNFNDCPTGQISGTTLGATHDGVRNCANGINNGVWYSFTTPPSGHVRLKAGDNAYHNAAVFDACGGTEIFCTPLPEDIIIPNLIPGNSYLLNIWSVAGYEANFNLCLEAMPLAPANDDCAGAFALSVGGIENCTPIQYTLSTATASAVPDPGCADYQGGDIWYSLTVPSSGYVTIESSWVSGTSSFSAGMAAYSGTCGGLSLIQCDDNSGSGDMPKLELSGLNPAEVIYIRFWEEGYDDILVFEICSYEPCIPPVFTANVIKDCVNNQFNIEVIVTNFGTATNLRITNSIDGSTEENIILSQTYSIGPFIADQVVDISVVNMDYPICASSQNGFSADCSLFYPLHNRSYPEYPISADFNPSFLHYEFTDFNANRYYFGEILSPSENVLWKFDGCQFTEIHVPGKTYLIQEAFDFLGNIYFSFLSGVDPVLHKYDGTNLIEIPNPPGYKYDVEGFLIEDFATGDLFFRYESTGGLFTVFKYTTAGQLIEIPNPTGYSVYRGGTFAGEERAFLDNSNNVYIMYQQTGPGPRVWGKYNGISISLVLDNGSNPFYGDFKAILANGNILLGELYEYNGSIAAMVPGIIPAGYSMDGYFPDGSDGTNYYFTFRNASNDYKCFVFDGTQLTEILSPTGGSCYFSFLSPSGDLFASYENIGGERELFRYDGLSYQTFSNPTGFEFNQFSLEWNDQYFFSYYKTAQTGFKKLVVFDQSTSIMSDLVNPGSYSYRGSHFTPTGSLYLYYGTYPSNQVLYRYNNGSLNAISNPPGYNWLHFMQNLHAQSFLVYGTTGTSSPYDGISGQNFEIYKLVNDQAEAPMNPKIFQYMFRQDDETYLHLYANEGGDSRFYKFIPNRCDDSTCPDILTISNQEGRIGLYQAVDKISINTKMGKIGKAVAKNSIDLLSGFEVPLGSSFIANPELSIPMIPLCMPPPPITENQQANK